ncbi:hypothetical protein IWQ60_003777 [Tieghemiomyces parasiticus]|uniref:RING-type domain-containing protein n=1 Tax=Tieghemiomyces parasiticus TaxID=78921 RepID=A0A9W8A9N8_9FUNG|nr:hypothetical protein IWQ60_003777 [Tieghemiomyces parasiticus]
MQPPGLGSSRGLPRFFLCVNLFFIGALGINGGVLTIANDHVSLDPVTFDVTANLTTSAVMTNQELRGRTTITNRPANTEGILFQYDIGNWPALLDSADHIVAITASSYDEIRRLTKAIQRPRIKAGIICPSSPSDSYDRIVLDRDDVAFSWYLIDHGSCKDLADQLNMFQRDPNNNTTADGDGGANQAPNGPSYYRAWTRLQYGGIMQSSTSSGLGSNVTLIIGIVVPIVIISFIVVPLFFLRRKQLTKKREEKTLREARLNRRLIKTQMLLAKSALSTRAPPLSDDLLTMVPLINYTETMAGQLLFCTEFAIQRFRMCHDALATSSDEDSDSDDDYEWENRGGDGCELIHAFRSTRSDSDGPTVLPRGVRPHITEEGTLRPSETVLDTAESVARRCSGGKGLDFTLATNGRAGDQGSGNRSSGNYQVSALPVSTDSISPRRLSGTRSQASNPPKNGQFGRSIRPTPLISRPRCKEKTVTYESVMQNLRQRRLVGSPQCPVCEDPFTPGEMLRHLSCQHAFHVDCVDEWLTKRSARCPLCKFNVTPGRALSAWAPLDAITPHLSV